MNENKIYEQIKRKKSFLSVGLDFVEYDFGNICRVIDETKEYAVAYKINTAFYEQFGHPGWRMMEKVLNYIPEDCFKIADAKRSDISNTSQRYAKTFFQTLNFDAVTVNPYMGRDSLMPFIYTAERMNKWVIILLLTSNTGAECYQMARLLDGRMLYEKVLDDYCNNDNVMFVVGANRHEELLKIRKTAPDKFLLVPGIGAQGGKIDTSFKQYFNDKVGILANSSRSVIYSPTPWLAASVIKGQMEKLL